MGDISRFRSIRQAISYCGLCGDEKRSAEKVMRRPLSKQRNKHIQGVLIEAAKLAPRRNPDLALVYLNARQKGNANCATLAVARKLVAYLMAVDREQRNFEPLREFTTAAAQKTATKGRISRSQSTQTARSRT
jgi:transposase